MTLRVRGVAIGAVAMLMGCVGAVPTPAPRAVADPASAAAPAPAPRALPRVERIALEGRAIQGGLMLGNVPEGTERLTLDGTSVAVAPDGRFLIAFDRDAGPIATLVAERSDGRRVTTPISVAPREWRIERLNSHLVDGDR